MRSEDGFGTDFALVPMPLEILSASDIQRYQITSKQEILRLLRDMMDQQSLIRAFFHNKSESFLTEIIHIDDKRHRVFFGIPAQKPLCQKMDVPQRLILSTTVDRIQIQFEIQTECMGMFGGNETLLASFPSSMNRFQRREFFRLETPVTVPILCEIKRLKFSDSGIYESYPIHDISIGGISLYDLPVDSIGVEMKDARFFLPEEGLVTVDLVVRNIVNIKLKNGMFVHRVGCQFVGLTTAMQKMIQRYILRLERERKKIKED